MKKYFLVPAFIGAYAFGGCTITHKVEPSDKPIKIDMNVNITQEIRVQLEKPVEDLINDNPDIF